MMLKESRQRSPLFALGGKFLKDRPNRIFGLLGFLFILSLGISFILGAYLYKSGYLSDTVRPAILRDIVYLPNKLHAMLTKPEVEHLVIDIKHKDYMKLAYSREIALSQGILFTSDDDYVNGKIRYKDKVYRVALRLKGDEPDHFSGDKWSLRIVIKGNETLFGMKRFSIQDPKTRNYLYEWVLHQALKMEGLIYHRYQFVDVTINGKDMGIYALEEHMDKQLIEHNQRRDGPILKFDEALYWKEMVTQGFQFRSAVSNGNSTYNASEVATFQTNKWIADSVGSLYINNAVSLLESFRRGILKTSDVFDVKKLAIYYAVMDLLGTANGTQWVNVRFYFNPVTARLEPIGRDGSTAPLIRVAAQNAAMSKPGDIRDRFLYAQVFSDTVFFKQYCKELERLSSPAYLDNFFASIADQLNKNLLIIHSEFPDFEFSKDLIYNNQAYIRTVLNPVKGFHAYFKNKEAGRLNIELGSIQSLPIEIISASYRDSLFFPVAHRQILYPYHDQETVDYKDVGFKVPEFFEWADSLIGDLKIYYKIIGAEQIRQEPVMPIRDLYSNFVKNDYVRQKPNFSTFDFMVKNEADKEIMIKPGKWTVDRTMIIPAGYEVVCGAGTQLNLVNGSSILSYSPLKFIGSEEVPISIKSEDSTGQGVVVISPNGSSILTYVSFKNLSNPRYRGWELTGAVTFYESDVEISHCQFINNNSEDGLNLVRSKFTIEYSLFDKTSSDAFDGDFIKGTVSNSSFLNCGNDAIDVSGSVVEVRDVKINGTGDKGLSNGENSELHVTNVDIKNAEIAVASKDISSVHIENISISGGHVGLTAYQKKPEFGPGSIEAFHLEMKNVALPYLVENRSQVTVDGEVIPPSRDNVKSILYGAEYGKASK